MKKLTRDELFGLFPGVFRERLEAMLTVSGRDGFIITQCQQLDSSSRGNMTAVAFGPNCTLKTHETPPGWHLHDAPSRREYPVAYYRKEA